MGLIQLYNEVVLRVLNGDVRPMLYTFSYVCVLFVLHGRFISYRVSIKYHFCLAVLLFQTYFIFHSVMLWTTVPYVALVEHAVFKSTQKDQIGGRDQIKWRCFICRTGVRLEINVTT